MEEVLFLKSFFSWLDTEFYLAFLKCTKQKKNK